MLCCSGENKSKAAPVIIKQIAAKAKSLAPITWKLDLLPFLPKPLADMLAASPMDWSIVSSRTGITMPVMALMPFD
jgi:hypothetical protein